MTKKIKFSGILTILILVILATSIFADDNEYTYGKSSILNDTKKKRIHNTNSADYMFEYSLELIKGGMYEEAIQKLNDLRSKFPGKLVSKMSHIYEGIAMVRMGKDYRSSANVKKALNKYHNIIKDFPEFSNKPSEDLVMLYVSLAELLRSYNMMDFSLLGQMEYSMMFFDKDVKDSLITEIAYIHYLRGNFYSAISMFSRSRSNKARFGLAKSYVAVGDIFNALITCDKLKEETTGRELVKLNKYYSYIKSLETNTPSGDPYSVNAEGKIINGSYKIFVGYSKDKEKAQKICDKIRKYNNTGFSVSMTPDGEMFCVSSSNVMDYKEAKTKMENLVLKGYKNTFIKEISFQ